MGRGTWNPPGTDMTAFLLGALKWLLLCVSPHLTYFKRNSYIILSLLLFIICLSCWQNVLRWWESDKADWKISIPTLKILTRIKVEICLSRPIQASVQFSSVDQTCPTLCNAMEDSTPGLPVHHQLPEFTPTHVHWVGDAI